MPLPHGWHPNDRVWHFNLLICEDHLRSVAVFRHSSLGSPARTPYHLVKTSHHQPINFIFLCTITAPYEGLMRMICEGTGGRGLTIPPHRVTEDSRLPVLLIQAVVQEERAKLGLRSICSVTSKLGYFYLLTEQAMLYTTQIETLPTWECPTIDPSASIASGCLCGTVLWGLSIAAFWTMVF